jgi:hypothetical protein
MEAIEAPKVDEATGSPISAGLDEARIGVLCARFGCSKAMLRTAVETVGTDECRLGRHLEFVHGFTQLLRQCFLQVPA